MAAHLSLVKFQTGTLAFVNKLRTLKRLFLLTVVGIVMASPTHAAFGIDDAIIISAAMHAGALAMNFEHSDGKPACGVECAGQMMAQVSRPIARDAAGNPMMAPDGGVQPVSGDAGVPKPTQNDPAGQKFGGLTINLPKGQGGNLHFCLGPRNVKCTRPRSSGGGSNEQVSDEPPGEMDATSTGWKFGGKNGQDVNESFLDALCQNHHANLPSVYTGGIGESQYNGFVNKGCAYTLGGYNNSPSTSIEKFPVCPSKYLLVDRSSKYKCIVQDVNDPPELLPDNSCRLTNTKGILHPDMRDPDCRDFKKLKPYDSGYVRVFDPTGKISVYANPDGSVAFEKESNVKGGTIKSGGTVTPNDDGTLSYKPGTSSYEHGATTGVPNPNSGGNTGPQGDAKPDGDGFDCKKASNCDWSKEGTQKQILESANKALDVQKDILKELKGEDLSGDKAAAEQKGKSGTNTLSDQQSDFFNQLKTQSLDIGPYSFGMNSFAGIQQTACQPIKWDVQGQSAELNICNIVDLVRLLLGFILYILTIARLINIFTGTENKEQAA